MAAPWRFRRLPLVVALAWAAAVGSSVQDMPQLHVPVWCEGAHGQRVGGTVHCRMEASPGKWRCSAAAQAEVLPAGQAPERGARLKTCTGWPPSMQEIDELEAQLQRLPPAERWAVHTSVHIHQAVPLGGSRWEAAQVDAMRAALVGWGACDSLSTVELVWHRAPLARLAVPGQPAQSELALMGGGSGVDTAAQLPSPVTYHSKCGAAWSSGAPAEPPPPATRHVHVLLWPAGGTARGLEPGQAVVSSHAMMAVIRGPVPADLLLATVCAVAEWQTACLPGPLARQLRAVAAHWSAAALNTSAEALRVAVTQQPFGWIGPVRLSAAFHAAWGEALLRHPGLHLVPEVPLDSWLAMYLPLPLILAAPLCGLLRVVLGCPAPVAQGRG